MFACTYECLTYALESLKTAMLYHVQEAGYPVKLETKKHQRT